MPTEMHTETIAPAKNKYKEAWDFCYKNLPPWRKKIVDDCIRDGFYEDRIYLEFVNATIDRAEKDEAPAPRKSL